MKRCPKCGEDKPLSEYYKDKHQSSGVTSVCMECKRAYSKKYLSTENGLKKKNEWLKHRYHIQDKEKQLARGKLKHAINIGKVSKPSECSSCRREYLSKDLHGHHTNYKRPLDVVWLCQICHKAEHGKIVDTSLVATQTSSRYWR